MPQKTTPIAQCENPQRGKTDEKKCLIQARADAVKAVAYCMLPLEPQNPSHGIFDSIEKWWHNRKELSSYQCAVREIAAKLPLYSPPKSANYTPPVYSRMEVDNIMQDGMRLSDVWAAQGRMRRRNNGRD